MKFLNLKSSLLAISALSLTNCGGSSPANILRGIQVKAEENLETGEMHATMRTQLGVTGILLPTIAIPIVDKKNQNTIIGNLQLGTDVSGKSLLTLDLNLTKAARIPGSIDGRLLPNGTLVPVADASSLKAFQVSDKARVYLGLSKEARILGVAVQVKAIHKMGKYIPGGQLMFPFQTKTKNLRGVAGLYMGSTEEQSGVTIFVDASKQITEEQVLEEIQSMDLRFE